MSVKSENKDDFDNFRKWQLNFSSWKTGKSHEEGHEKSWNLKSQKSTNPVISIPN